MSKKATAAESCCIMDFRETRETFTFVPLSRCALQTVPLCQQCLQALNSGQLTMDRVQQRFADLEEVGWAI